jgi:ABC-type proline/glycine betaine transport systems, periplasmic components
MTPEVHACNQDPECNKVGISGFPAAPVVNVVTTDFAEREPEAYELISNVTFPNDAMASLMAWHSENQATIDEAVVRFLQQHQDVWGDWVTDEAMANLDGLF